MYTTNTLLQTPTEGSVFFSLVFLNGLFLESFKRPFDLRTAVSFDVFFGFFFKVNLLPEIFGDCFRSDTFNCARNGSNCSGNYTCVKIKQWARH